ncbi:MAG: hypothetical protein ACRC8Y_12525 [Chroococcales cyanobacterium]
MLPRTEEQVMMESGNWQEWVTVWGYLGFTLLIMGCIWVAGKR